MTNIYRFLLFVKTFWELSFLDVNSLYISVVILLEWILVSCRNLYLFWRAEFAAYNEIFIWLKTTEQDQTESLKIKFRRQFWCVLLQNIPTLDLKNPIKFLGWSSRLTALLDAVSKKSPLIQRCSVVLSSEKLGIHNWKDLKQLWWVSHLTENIKEWYCDESLPALKRLDY